MVGGVGPDQPDLVWQPIGAFVLARLSAAALGLPNGLHAGDGSVVSRMPPLRVDPSALDRVE